MNMLNSGHLKTLHLIFSLPTSSAVEWRKMEVLFIALGAKVSEGKGSRVRFEINNVVPLFIDRTRRKKQKFIRCVMPKHSLRL
ncbi:hypothetical protein [Rahnella contaminans]|uniref:hypothetical protein n=1 Tax=Rahnella contaminans TaxID=2703882 RepID=UPI0023DA16E2|nr:hypothetical protein [Rahnella contaminans]MDF1894357.1 hypothetical protein [Rahnella contaminans]